MPVYMIQAGESGPVKIGWAKEPHTRIRELQTGSSAPLQLLRLFEGGRAEEVRLHTAFAGKRLRGEWFMFSPEMLTESYGLKPMQLPAHDHAPRRGFVPERIMFNFRTAPVLKTAAESAAKDSGQTLTALVESLLVAHLKENGYGYAQ